MLRDNSSKDGEKPRTPVLRLASLWSSSRFEDVAREKDKEQQAMVILHGQLTTSMRYQISTDAAISY
jgi:hypothetical protein